MYGLYLEAVNDYINESYGEDVGRLIDARAEISYLKFVRHQMYNVIFRRDMTMYRIGDDLKEVFSDLQGKKVDEEFTPVQPMLKFSWDNVVNGEKWDGSRLEACRSDQLMLCFVFTCSYVVFIYTHLNNVFKLLSKGVVESKQKVNIPKLGKEEPEEKEESEKPKKEERDMVLTSVVTDNSLSHNS
ncbi:hypothetical protein E1301_Tti006814 [Triplophysa tibetana]|uniref:guanylate cyclase n=1 Tax=Triplophysa tibetana TaxID=1572043 RepID=A0A5A9N320_9TELE|nr:hypothetical protein E1301_Tti006814 [Triplophysa tibetana]